MRSALSGGGLVLGVAPGSRGFGFALFEAAHLPIDWGVKEIRGVSAKRRPLEKNRRCLESLERLLDDTLPAVLVLEDWRVESSQRSPRINSLLHAMTRSARRRNVVPARYSRAQMRKMFSAYDAHSKDEIAAAIAGIVPELHPKLPPRRKPWQSEHYAMAMFEAAGLVLTHYAAIDP
jgi:hypothetical protein